MVMFSIDGILLLSFSALMFVIAQKDYSHAKIWLRAILYSIVFFAFCCATHALGILRHQWAVAYWARVALDACLVIAATARVLEGRFLPPAPKK